MTGMSNVRYSLILIFRLKISQSQTLCHQPLSLHVDVRLRLLAERAFAACAKRAYTGAMRVCFEAHIATLHVKHAEDRLKREKMLIEPAKEWHFYRL